MSVWSSTTTAISIELGNRGGYERAEDVRRPSGLRFKFFTLDEKQQRAMTIYVWDSEEAAKAFFSDELRERVAALYGASPTISYLEIA